SYLLIEKYNLSEKSTIILHGQLNAKMIASSIAIWLQGYTLVLLDSELNDERKRQILASINPSLIISNIIDNSFNYKKLTFDKIDTVDSTNTITIDEPQNWHKIPAYITFTSGSTGEPKGILSSHQGFSHFINWQKQEFNIDETHRCGQFTSITFDVIYRSVFTPLLGGATLLLSPFDVFESQNTVNWISENKITMFNIVPSVLNFWLDTTQVEELKNLKYIFSAGEKLTNSLLKKLKIKWRYHS
ncbi:AMP-binding protein, partial [Francisella noatunensis]|nr:AMP-binding protein [Francisella noatunensis]